MFKAILSTIGFFVLSVRLLLGQMSLFVLAERLWIVILFSMVMGSVLDLSFNCFYKEAVEKMNQNGK